MIKEVQKIYYNNSGISASRLLQLYKNRKKYNSSSFLEFYQTIIDEMVLKDKIRSARTNQNYLNKLKLYQSTIYFSDLSVQFAKDYDNWMLKRKNKVNTRASNLKAIYSVLNKAVKLGLIQKNPFKGYAITTENVEKQSLTYNEITSLTDLKIEKRHKGMIKARDMFLFSFYSAGMRFSDVCKLRWINIVGNDIVYTMEKSKSRAGSRRTIPLNPKSIEILEKYKGKDDVFIFPPLYGYEKANTETIEKRLYIQNNAVNRSLRIIGEKLNFSFNLTMHIAKHSFADYAVKNDVGILILSKLLGHTKLSTTQHYLKDFYHKEESDTINKLFGSL
ncbi:MAG: tyrosine-type recombinase/integrase [Flavobacteriaceae bacterium]